MAGSGLAGVAGTVVGSAEYRSSIFAPSQAVSGPPAPTPPAGDALLLENGGFYLLQENGSKILLE
jgi:hypothetical protein